MVLGLLQIFLQLYLIELLGFLIGLRLLELQHLIHSRILTGFGMLVFFLCNFGSDICLILSFLNNTQFQVVLDGKSLNA